MSKETLKYQVLNHVSQIKKQKFSVYVIYMKKEPCQTPVIQLIIR